MTESTVLFALEAGVAESAPDRADTLDSLTTDSQAAFGAALYAHIHNPQAARRAPEAPVKDEPGRSNNHREGVEAFTARREPRHSGH